MIRLAERVNTVKNAEQLIKLNKLKDYEIIVMWEEEEEMTKAEKNIEKKRCHLKC